MAFATLLNDSLQEKVTIKTAGELRKGTVGT